MISPNHQPSIRVILADDHAVVRAGTRQFLEQAGGIEIVAEADNGVEAIRVIEEHQPDVAVLDIQMPGKSGIEVTRWTRSRHLPVGILVLTAYDDDPYVLAVLKAGANGYLLKTSPPDELVQAVRDVNQGKAVLDSSLTERLLTRVAGKQLSSKVDQLTEREIEILTLAGRGFTNKAIGFQLGISDRTVQNHLARIFDKMHVESRTEAVMRGVSLGLLSANLTEMN